MFHGSIETIEKREKTPEFQPRLKDETNPQERERILQLVVLKKSNVNVIG